uniref:B30.2/SPRY domain-containing protein n=1 Tax=Xiphophorus couchianus TaxID=32473 RepID=A0A3B5M6D8_9TELE
GPWRHFRTVLSALTGRCSRQQPLTTTRSTSMSTRTDLGSEYVLLFRDGQFDVGNQNPSYQNRVDLVDQQMKDGNVSLVLKNLTTNDTGLYQCQVQNEGSLDTELIRTIRLEVLIPPVLLPVSGALIDVAKHLGNLSFNIWNKMKHLVSYTPVVLDPNSANFELILSEDLTSVRCGQKQNIPDNPERFDFFRIVLGSEGFMTGTYSWDVEVGDNTDWFVGVASQDVQRKGNHPSRLWRIGCIDGQYMARALSEPSTVLEPMGKVAVYVDCPAGTLSFYRVSSDTLIHIYTANTKFTEPLYPGFGFDNKTGSWMSLCSL